MKLAREEVGPAATAAQLRDALRSARQRRPDLAEAYDSQRVSLLGPDGIIRFTLANGLEVEIPTPRAAESMIAARVNQLVMSGEAKDALEGLEIAEREAPELMALFRQGLDDLAAPMSRDEPPVLHTYSTPAEAGALLEKRMTELLAAGEAKTEREALVMAIQDLPQVARGYNGQ